MWWFRKKPARDPATAPAQEFLRSYVPPAPKAVPNPIEEETVCPVCFQQFPAGTLSVDWPSCPDCSSEGIDCEVEPEQSFLMAKSLEELDEIARRWNAAQGFLPQYKTKKADSIARLRARKAADRG